MRAARARLPEGMGRRTGRADRGFCAGAFLDFLEAQAWPYVVGARLATTLQRQGAGRKEWTALDEHHAAGAFTVKIILVDQGTALRGRARAGAGIEGGGGAQADRRAGRHLPGVGDQPERGGGDLVAGRGGVEQRIEELKHDLAADGFCLQPFYATEAAFLAVRFTFNLLSPYPHQTTPPAAYRPPGILRVAVFLCEAGRGMMGREVVLKLSAAWGGLGKHKPLVAATLDWLKCPAPKLVPPADRLALGGGLI